MEASLYLTHDSVGASDDIIWKSDQRDGYTVVLEEVPADRSSTRKPSLHRRVGDPCRWSADQLEIGTGLVEQWMNLLYRDAMGESGRQRRDEASNDSSDGRPASEPAEERAGKDGPAGASIGTPGVRQAVLFGVFQGLMHFTRKSHLRTEKPLDNRPPDEKPLDEKLEAETQSALLCLTALARGVRHFGEAHKGVLLSKLPGASLCLRKLESFLLFELFQRFKLSKEDLGFFGGAGADNRDAEPHHDLALYVAKHALISFGAWIGHILGATNSPEEWNQLYLGSRSQELDSAIDYFVYPPGGPEYGRRLFVYAEFLGLMAYQAPGSDIASQHTPSDDESTTHTSLVRDQFCEMSDGFTETLWRVQDHYAAQYVLPRLGLPAEALDEFARAQHQGPGASEEKDAGRKAPAGIKAIVLRLSKTRAALAKFFGACVKLFDRFEKELRATIRPIPVSVFLGIFGLSFALPPVCYLLGWPEGINWVLTGLLFLLTPVALVFVSRQLLTRRQRAPYVRVLPRLWGAVLVGYLPLVTEASLWTACDSLSGPTSVFLVVASITIAWGYIYVSVTQRVRNYEKAMSRATILTTVGLLQSLFVGLLLFSTIGAPLAEEALQARQQTLMPEKTGVAHEAQQEVTANQRAAEEDSMMIELRCPWNPFDLVRFPARPLFVWCPVALFLGVVLQLLWIDRSIVDPV